MKATNPETQIPILIFLSVGFIYQLGINYLNLLTLR